MLNDNFEQYRYVDTIPRTIKVKRLVWSLAWTFFFRPTPRWFGHSWRRFLLKLFGAKIGKGCRVAPSCFVWAPWNFEMGQYSVLGDGVDCYSMDLIRIGSKVAVSQRSFLCTGSHCISSLRRPLLTKPIIINDHVWVCAEAFIGPGVSLGEGAVVAARGVVVKDVPDWIVVGGNPAKPIKVRQIVDEV